MQNQTGSVWIVGVMFFGVLIAAAMASSLAQAQTTSVGPYYATPSWDQTLPSATRFIILSNFLSEAVLDRETGLVWEKAPSTASSTWSQARFDCFNKTVGNRKGWRLPSMHELASLIDPTVVKPGPTLPAGHPFPFTNVLRASYWSATTNAEDPTAAWVVGIGNAEMGSASKISLQPIWCVRGGMNAEAY